MPVSAAALRVEARRHCDLLSCCCIRFVCGFFVLAGGGKGRPIPGKEDGAQIRDETRTPAERGRKDRGRASLGSSGGPEQWLAGLTKFPLFLVQKVAELNKTKSENRRQEGSNTVLTRFHADIRTHTQKNFLLSFLL